MTMLNNYNDIEAWLDKYRIKNYIINPDYTVDAVGYVNLFDKQLTSIPVAFNRVVGTFDCGNNELTSLKGSPKIVEQTFNCRGNRLTSLEGGPLEVSGNYFCYDNQLISLLGSPLKVKGDFSCYNNKLTSLRHTPLSVGGFAGYNNDIDSLEFCPEEVISTIFLADGNPRLGEYQRIQDFSIIRAEHLRIQAVLQEQAQLDNMMAQSTPLPRAAFKI